MDILGWSNLFIHSPYFFYSVRRCSIAEALDRYWDAVGAGKDSAINWCKSEKSECEQIPLENEIFNPSCYAASL